MSPAARLIALAVGLLLTATGPASAGFVFSNINTFSGVGASNGGAATAGGNTITRLVADDITPIAGSAGQNVTGFTFSVANFNPTAVSARALVRFYADAAAPGPGTLLAALNFNPIAFAAGSVGLFTFTSGTPLFTLPSGRLWAGITFDNNNGATGASLTQMNNLGQGIFGPPTVGSSLDLFFRTTAAGGFVANNPAGGLLFFGGNPPANFGWAIQTADPPPASPTPVPPTALAAVIGLFGMAGLRRVRRQAG